MATQILKISIDDEEIILTGKAKEQYLLELADRESTRLGLKSKDDEKAAKKSALLLRLGISETEAQLLLG